MNNFLRTIIAGYGAKKLGGGCFSTILIFFLIYWALGNCNSHSNNQGGRAMYQQPVHNSIYKSAVNKTEHNTAHL